MSDSDPGQSEKTTNSCGCRPGTCCRPTPVTQEIPGDTCTCETLPKAGAGPTDNDEQGALGEFRGKEKPDTASIPVIIPVSGTLTAGDIWGHILARLGQNREGHRIDPGLYSLGSPGPDSPVIVTANYTLSFDSVRSSLAGRAAYILVLDTRGINVWCAAGKGTFGTEELITRIHTTGLSSVVTHHRLILPQLGAPGIAAHEVYKATGFHVEYGPVRASDLPAFLRDRVASPEMRIVKFNLRDRAVLIPVELRHVALYAAIATITLWFFGGWLPAAGFLAAVLAGTVIFPLLLPFLPSVDFSTKGMVLGIIVAVPFAALAFLNVNQGGPAWPGLLTVIALLFTLPVITAYLALNFTGCTPYTSRTGVRKEIYRYIPFMAGSAVIGVTCALLYTLTGFLGVW